MSANLSLFVLSLTYLLAAFICSSFAFLEDNCELIEKWIKKPENRRKLPDKFSFEVFSRIHEDLSVSKKEKLLGKGGFAHVYKIFYRSSEEVDFGERALKVVDYIPNPENEKEMTYLECLDQELKILIELGSKNPLHLVSLNDCVRDNENRKLYIIMEKLEHTLNNPTFLNDFSSRPLVEVAGIFNQMGLAVKIFHDNGFLHNDIKPNNFMVGSESLRIIKLIDYGLSSGVEKPVFSGTPIFKAPERYTKDYQSSFKSDIFSLGVTYFGILNRFKFASATHFLNTSKAKDWHTATIMMAEQIRKVCRNQAELNTIKIHGDGGELNKIENHTKIINIIMRMVDPLPHNRPSIDEVIARFELIIVQYDPNSLYLSQNKRSLEIFLTEHIQKSLKSRAEIKSSKIEADMIENIYSNPMKRYAKKLNHGIRKKKKREKIPQKQRKVSMLNCVSDFLARICSTISKLYSLKDHNTSVKPGIWEKSDFQNTLW